MKYIILEIVWGNWMEELSRDKVTPVLLTSEKYKVDEFINQHPDSDFLTYEVFEVEEI